MRIVQPAGQKGSLLWIQRAVAERWADLEHPLGERIGNDPIIWRSPLAEDSYAEYRDGAFLERLGLGRLSDALTGFWPLRGPQWDALASTGSGRCVLVEAKAHVAEFCSPASAASAHSLARIRAAFEIVARALGSANADLWHRLFYQYANRLAHLWFLRAHGVEAYLLLVSFVGVEEMGGPSNAEAWQAAYRIADHALGLRARHPLAPYLIHAYPQVRL